ncbi:MAG: hypothetical protein GF350_09220 [Chitinivibrionales bacterium]|nr:hypothetical protein [Chitinivibrionales bacterium]
MHAKAGFFLLIFILCNVLPCFAVDGLGVAARGGITAYRIENDRTAETWRLFEGAGKGTGSGSPVINTHGSHVAFWRRDERGDIRHSYISIVRADISIDHPDWEKKDLFDIEFIYNWVNDVLVDERQQAYITEISWPQGDWIWYGHNHNRDIWRVNVQTGERQHVATLQYKMLQLMFGGLNGEVYVHGSGKEEAFDNRAMYAMPDPASSSIPVDIPHTRSNMTGGG